MSARCCLLVAALVLQASQSAYAQIDVYSGTMNVGGSAVYFELYGAPGATVLAGRGRSPAIYNGGKIERWHTYISATVTEVSRSNHPLFGSCQAVVTFAEPQLAPMAYTRQYTVGGPMTGTMTLNKVGVGVWADNAPASITMTRGTTTLRKEF